MLALVKVCLFGVPFGVCVFCVLCWVLVCRVGLTRCVILCSRLWFTIGVVCLVALVVYIARCVGYCGSVVLIGVGICVWLRFGCVGACCGCPFVSSWLFGVC